MSVLVDFLFIYLFLLINKYKNTGYLVVDALQCFCSSVKCSECVWKQSTQSLQLCFQACRQYFVLSGIFISCQLWVSITVYIVCRTQRKQRCSFLSSNTWTIIHILEKSSDSCYKSKYMVAWFLIDFYFVFSHFHVAINLSDTGIISSVYIKYHGLVWRAPDKITPNS